MITPIKDDERACVMRKGTRTRRRRRRRSKRRRKRRRKYRDIIIKVRGEGKNEGKSG